MFQLSGQGFPLTVSFLCCFLLSLLPHMSLLSLLLVLFLYLILFRSLLYTGSYHLKGFPCFLYCPLLIQGLLYPLSLLHCQGFLLFLYLVFLILCFPLILFPVLLLIPVCSFFPFFHLLLFSLHLMSSHNLPLLSPHIRTR